MASVFGIDLERKRESGFRISFRIWKGQETLALLLVRRSAIKRTAGKARILLVGRAGVATRFGPIRRAFTRSVSRRTGQPQRSAKMGNLVQCRKCGFLCGLLESDRITLVEIGRHERKHGLTPPKTMQEPLCFWEIMPEIGTDQQASNQQKRVLAVTGVDRVCEKYAEYIRGYGPKEMHQMLLSQEAIQIAKDTAKDQRDWQGDQNEKMAKANKDAQWTTAAVTAFATVVAGALGFVASCTTTGKPDKATTPAFQMQQGDTK
jgi:hypothetical protein